MKRFVAVVFLWVPMVAAQARQPLQGVVRDAAGKPVSGATVTLVWTPLGGDEEGPSDVITCRSDAAGAFAAELLTGEGYSAWAIQDLGGGQFACSAIGEDVAPGGRCELRLGAPRWRQEFSLTGAEEWPDQGPLRLFVVPPAANPCRFPVVKGFAPPLPPNGVALVVGGGGNVLASCWIDANEPVHVAVPKPVEVSIQAVDSKGGPIAGATVSAALGVLPRGRGLFQRPQLLVWNRLAITGQDGCATVVLPMRRQALQGPASAVTVRVEGPGFAAATKALFWMNRELWVTGVGEALRPLGDTKSVPIPLLPACRVRCNDRGHPCADGFAVLEASYPPSALDRQTARVRFDGSGLATLPISADPVETRLRWRRPDGERTWLRLPFMSGQTTTADLANTRRVAMILRRADGSPAAGVPVLFVPDGSSVDVFPRYPVYSDPEGKCVLWLDESAWLFAACDGADFGEAAVPRGAMGADLVVTMLPLARASIRCRQGNGDAEDRPQFWFVDRERVDAHATRWGIDRLLHHGLWRDARLKDGAVDLPMVARREGRPRVNLQFGETVRTVELDPAVPANVVWRK